jgi:hypothetical protein
LSDVSKKTLAVLAIVVAAAAGFVGALYGGGVSLGTKTETVTSVLPITITASTTTTSGYVYIAYYGYIYSRFGDYTPPTGYKLLVLYIVVVNHGYDSVPIAPQYFYLDFGNYHEQISPTYEVRVQNSLQQTDVLNGLQVVGYLPFLIPANGSSYSLIYKPASGDYNVQYELPAGVTTVTTT